MTATPPDNLNSQPSNADLDQEQLLRSLRRKEGTWHNWGIACQQLQKAGYNPQQVFEATGFEPIQQNQLIVAAQVYESIHKVGVPTAVQERFERTGSDSLYELRILNQGDRAAAAELIVEKGIDSEGAREVAKALKDFSRLSTPPAEFSNPPGDAVAYHFWRLARQQSDLQMRSRLIAMALRFASSDSARQQAEKLLTDFTVTQAQKAPSLPLYRFESESELPRILPVVGKLPLTVSDLQAVPLLEEEGAFRLVKFSGTGAWVAVPGWQIVFSAEDPVVILTDSDRLPQVTTGAIEEFLVMIDRAQRSWDINSYFMVEQDGELQVQWFAELPNLPILGRVLVVLRPKKVLDEDFNKELWQTEE